MASVSIANVWKYYGKTAAVKELKLEAADGEFLCGPGPVGLRQVLDPAHAGRAWSISRPATSASARSGSTTCRRRTATSRWCSRTTRSTRTRPCSRTWPTRCGCAGSIGATIERKVARRPRLLEIGHLLERRAGRTLGRAEATHRDRPGDRARAQLFLFDEPIAHLDAKLRAHMRGELKHHAARAGHHHGLCDP